MRQQIRDEIAAIVPFDALERQHHAEALAWIDSGADLCRIAKPATPPRHLVSYFVCMDGDHVLLVDHKNALLWLPSGGHVELGEHPRDTVRREAVEELNLAAEFVFPQPVLITCTETVGMTAGHWDVSLWYVIKGDRTQPVSCDESEFHSVQWFAPNDVPLHRADPHMGRFLEKLQGIVNPQSGE